MKVKAEEKLTKSRIKLVIEINQKELEKFINQAYQEISQSLKIPGFRPGKAPKFLIEQEVGNEQIQQKILEIALPNTYYQAIKENKILPIGPPEIKLTKFVPQELLVYEAIISVIPEVDLGDYKNKIKKSGLKLKEPKITSQQIEAVIKNLQKQRAKIKKVQRPSKKGDRVEIDFDVFVEGKKIDEASSKNYPLIIGEGIMIPGFEENLIGLKQDEEKKFSLKFPDEFFKKELAGKKADFKVKVKEVHELDLPQVDDKFAQEIGVKDLKTLKSDIEKSLFEDLLKQNKIDFQEKMIDKLIKDIEIDIPIVLIQEEIDSMIKNLEQRLSNTGITLERYLEQIKKTKEDLKKEWQPEAEKRIKIALILDKIAQKENIKVSEEEIDKECENILNSAPKEEKDKLKKELVSPDRRKYIKNIIKNKKVIEFLENLILK